MVVSKDRPLAPRGISTKRAKATTATPSLNKLSPSKSTVRFLLAPNSRKRATTATGSVEERLAPTNNAVNRGKLVNSSRVKPTPKIEIITPTIAKRLTGIQLSFRSRQRVFQAASNSKGGRKISRISSGDRFTRRISIKAKPKPTITNNRV